MSAVVSRPVVVVLTSKSISAVVAGSVVASSLVCLLSVGAGGDKCIVRGAVFRSPS